MKNSQKQENREILDESVGSVTVLNEAPEQARANQSVNTDVMDAFGGFLDKRKKDRNMQRNTEMSQVDHLVKTLQSDIDLMMIDEKKK